MPRARRKGKQRIADLTFDQLGELIWGPGAPDGIAFNPATNANRRSEFASPLTRRAAYFMHKDAVMEHHLPGQRPWAYYEFDLREHPPEDVAEAAFLRSKGLSEPWEEAQLQAWESQTKGDDE